MLGSPTPRCFADTGYILDVTIPVWLSKAAERQKQQKDLAGTKRHHKRTGYVLFELLLKLVGCATAHMGRAELTLGLFGRGRDTRPDRVRCQISNCAWAAILSWLPCWLPKERATVGMCPVSLKGPATAEKQARNIW